MAKELKQLIVEEMGRRYAGLDRCVIVNFTGISAGLADEIRSRLRRQNIDLHVVKNSLMARAFEKIGLEKLVGLLEGPCAVVTGGKDVVDLAKAACELTQKTRNIVIRGGYGEGLVLASGDVRRFATIEPRPVLIAKLLGSIKAPVNRMVWTLGAFVRNFVSVLDAAAKKRGTGEEAAGSPSELKPGPQDLTAAAEKKPDQA
jgi:large subunit ribosomal protein L10